MLSWISVALGVLLIAAALVDLYITVIAAAGGGGPVTRALSRVVWRTARRVRVGDVHRRLSAAGHLVLIAVVVGWLLMIWSGFALLFLSDPGSVIDSTTTQPAGVVAKLAFAAGGLAGAGAGFIASSGGWEALNNLAAVVGLSWAALTLTYLFQVVTAASHERALALHILGIADDPTSMAAVGAGGEDLGGLGQHLTSVTHGVALLSRYHQALPALPYFHVGERRAAIEVAIAVLDEALTILEATGTDAIGVARPTRVAIEEFIRTARTPIDARPPQVPSVAGLRRAGVDVDRDTLQRHADALAQRRCALRAIVEQRGWDWDTDVLLRDDV